MVRREVVASRGEGDEGKEKKTRQAQDNEGRQLIAARPRRRAGRATEEAR
jgi:hypothetical protein